MKDNCLICIEETSTYLVFDRCRCRIYGHIECVTTYMEKENKCMICKTAYKDENRHNKEDKENIVHFLHQFDFLNEWMKCTHNFFLFVLLSFLISLFLLFPVFLYFSLKKKLRSKEKTEKNYTLNIC